MLNIGYVFLIIVTVSCLSSRICIKWCPQQHIRGKLPNNSCISPGSLVAGCIGHMNLQQICSLIQMKNYAVKW